LQFFTNAGVPMAGGFLYTYAAGTTTPLVTYTDSTGLVANTNPVILDSRGEASIWLGGVGYKFKLATPANVDIWTQDNIAPGSSAYMSYVPAGTGAVTTTVQAKLRESVSVKDFGAVGDGVADDTAAIQLAINAAQLAGGGTVFFPAGSYKVSATLLINQPGVYLLGAGMWNTNITRSGDYGDTILFTGNDATGAVISKAGISNLTIKSTGLTTSGAHIKMNGVTRADLSNLFLENGFIGFDFLGLTAAYVSTVYLVFTNIFGGIAAGRKYMRCASAAATYGHPSCGDLFITDFNLRGNIANTNTEIGIDVTSADGIWFENGHVGNTTVANLRFTASDALSPIGLVFFSQVMFDESIGAGAIFQGVGAIAPGGVARNIMFSNCNWKGGATGSTGVSVPATATYNNVQFANCFITEFLLHGVSIASAAATNWSFTGCQVRGNSYTATNVTDGYFITACDKLQIVGGQSGGHNVIPGVSSQRYGVNIGASATNVVISGIDLRGNLTQSLIVNGAARPTTSLSGLLLAEVPSVASASTLDSLEGYETQRVTGTTTINNIQVRTRDAPLTLIFAGIVTVTELGNVRLKGAFTSTADAALTLSYDDVTNLWYEVSRASDTTPGRVLQIVAYGDVGGATTSVIPTYVGVSFSFLTITPISATSRLIFNLSMNLSSAFVAATDTIAYANIYDGVVGSPITNGAGFVLADASGVGSAARINFSINVASTGVIARNFGVSAATNNASSAATVGNVQGYCMEVQL
jgi:hypothetical protein